MSDNSKKDEQEDQFDKIFKNYQDSNIKIDLNEGQIQMNASDIWEAATEIIKRLFFWQNKN